jgi:hypothetical protein
MKRNPPLAINAEIRKLQKISALLVAVQFASNEEVDFDVADALAVVVATVRIENGPLPSGHPLAWLEPHRWMPDRVTCPAERMRPVGRFQRMVSWATDGKLISPDWSKLFMDRRAS